ncbi:hypothetical protein CRX72_27150 [Pantoea sp. BRM17]|nr:hypothetical protein CRX72_27150 [Pantoea sp. BRM17]
MALCAVAFCLACRLQHAGCRSRAAAALAAAAATPAKPAAAGAAAVSRHAYAGDRYVTDADALWLERIDRQQQLLRVEGWSDSVAAVSELRHRLLAQPLFAAVRQRAITRQSDGRYRFTLQARMRDQQLTQAESATEQARQRLLALRHLRTQQQSLLQARDRLLDLQQQRQQVALQYQHWQRFWQQLPGLLPSARTAGQLYAGAGTGAASRRQLMLRVNLLPWRERQWQKCCRQTKYLLITALTLPLLVALVLGGYSRGRRARVLGV